MTEQDIATTIIKQVAAKLTSFGFSNSPREAAVFKVGDISDSVFVVRLAGIVPADVYALVIRKDHSPVPAYHVLDFRVGSNIYS